MASLIRERQVVFAVGPAGTGKTHIATGCALEMYDSQKVQGIVATRPMVSVGAEIGFLPGDIDEKYDPYLVPINEAIIELGHPRAQERMSIIEGEPIALIRGRTFNKCFIIVDEAQNLTKAEFLAVLTRLGKGSKMVFTGDPVQADIADSGLIDAVNRFSGDPDVGIVQFGLEDIQRADFVGRVIRSYAEVKYA